MAVSPFVGRAAELAELRAAFERAAAGRTQVVLLVGEPGIGKTRLLEECFASLEPAAAHVSWGACHEWEGSPPYWPWMPAFRTLLDAPGADADNLRTDLGPAAVEIAQLLPEVRERWPDLPALQPLPPNAARFRLFEALAGWLSRAAARRPLLLILDDLHWADAASLLLLEFVAREVRTAPLLLVGTYRNVELRRRHPLADTLSELARESRCLRLPLSRLPKDMVGAYLTETAGSTPRAALLDAVYAETEGNPFFMTEIARLLIAEGGFNAEHGAPMRVRLPESVREVIGRRLNRLSDACTATLGIAAVLGREFELALLARVSETSADELLTRLDAALSARLLDEGAQLGHFRFSHALIQETLYDELSVAQRGRLHRRVAEELETLGTDERLDALAYHCGRAAALGLADKAVEYSVRAAERATAQYAWEGAVAHYERALEALELLSPRDERRRGELLLALGAAQWRAGDSRAAQTASRAAAQIARDIGDVELLARAAFTNAGGGSGFTFSDAATVELLEAALDALSRDDSLLRAQLLARLANFLDSGQDAVERRERLAAEALAMAQRLRDPSTLVYAHSIQYGAHTGVDDLPKRLTITAEFLETARLSGDIMMMTLSHHYRVMALLEAGCVPDARRQHEQIIPLAAIHSGRSGQWGILIFTTIVELIAGRFDVAERLAEEALSLGLAAAPFAGAAYATYMRVIRKEQDRLQDVEHLLNQHLGADPQDDAFWRAALAGLHSCCGRPEYGRQLFDALAVDDFGAIQRNGYWLVTLACLVETCVELGDVVRGATLRRLLDPYVARYVSSPESPWIVYGSVAHYLGQLATLLDDDGAAERYFATALALHERLESPPYISHTRYAWAALLAKRGVSDDADRAREMASQALTTAEELGMTRLARLARALLASLAAAPVSAPLHSLTARELEVLRLVVDGLPDREIAERLFVSPRTVGTHVGNILNKLGLNSRAAAAAWAARHDVL
jgi:DNA-binding CsgD family transcriptional regulator